MPNKKNTQEVADLKDKVGKAKSIVFANYQKLTVKEQTTLRSAIREAGGELVVTKNTLLKIAMQNDDKTLDSALQGQTAALFSYEDEVAPLKALVSFTKEHDEKPEIKLGFMEGNILSLESVMALAKLPGKAELIATAISRIQGPAYGLVNVIQATTRNLVYALEAIRKQKETATA